jgi:hypothetical protein
VLVGGQPRRQGFLTRILPATSRRSWWTRPAAPPLGISPRQGRSTALFTPAAEVPAAILAKTLGIHVQAAIQWQKISAGD